MFLFDPGRSGFFARTGRSVFRVCAGPAANSTRPTHVREGVMVNFMCQLAWAIGCPESRLNIIFERVYEVSQKR